jgi:hypothetical protein
MSMKYSSYRFDMPIDDKVYRQLNKEPSINSLFRSDKVGKCAKLFDDYYKSVEQIESSEWYEYYLERYPKVLANTSLAITSLDINDSFAYVKHRIIGQTWNGMLNEIALVKELQEQFPNLTFEKADYNKDEQYFTDFECFSNGILVLGLQIKPITYKYMSNPYQLKAKDNHNKQRDLYKITYGVPHFLIYYEKDELYDKQNVFNQINLLLTNLINQNNEN